MGELSLVLRNIINDVKVDLAKEYKLHKDDFGFIDDIVMLVFLQAFNITEYVSNKKYYVYKTYCFLFVIHISTFEIINRKIYNRETIRDMLLYDDITKYYETYLELLMPEFFIKYKVLLPGTTLTVDKMREKAEKLFKGYIRKKKLNDLLNG